MAGTHISITVKVIYPKRVTFKMLLGAVAAWITGNVRYLLKFGWNIHILDGDVS